MIKSYKKNPKLDKSYDAILLFCGSLSTTVHTMSPFSNLAKPPSCNNENTTIGILLSRAPPTHKKSHGR